MTVYTYSEARSNLAALLDRARSEGEILIKSDDGQVFLVKPLLASDSPLDVDGIDLGISADEIVKLVREARERS